MMGWIQWDNDPSWIEGWLTVTDHEQPPPVCRKYFTFQSNSAWLEDYIPFY